MDAVGAADSPRSLWEKLTNRPWDVLRAPEELKALAEAARNSSSAPAPDPAAKEEEGNAVARLLKTVLDAVGLPELQRDPRALVTLRHRLRVLQPHQQPKAIRSAVTRLDTLASPDATLADQEHIRLVRARDAPCLPSAGI